MDRQEYLKCKFESDFLRYSLLQEDSLSAKIIAERLYEAVNLDGTIVEGKQKIGELCDKYLSFEKVKVSGKLSNELSQELGYDLKDRIVGEYQSFLDGFSNTEIVKSVVEKVERKVELQAWSNGIVNMHEAITLLVGKLNNLAESYNDFYMETLSEDELQEKFDRAKENTLLERIRGNNIDDIIEYRNTLLEYVREHCENMLYAKLKDICDIIANDKVFDRLRNSFNTLLEYAHDLKASLSQSEPNEEWDKEYNFLIPTDFYQRNVEDITAEQAFHMVLLHFFAKNEDWLIKNGMLVERELKIYTNSHSCLCMLIGTLCKNLLTCKFY